VLTPTKIHQWKRALKTSEEKKGVSMSNNTWLLQGISQKTSRLWLLLLFGLATVFATAQVPFVSVAGSGWLGGIPLFALVVFILGQGAITPYRSHNSVSILFLCYIATAIVSILFSVLARG